MNRLSEGQFNRVPMLNSIVYVKVDAGCDMIGTNLQIHAPKLMRLFMANLYLQNYFRGGKGLDLIHF